MFEILRVWIENLNFGKIGFKTCVFEKHFISYSCTWFIKFNALRSFCIILLCFSKKLIFPEFRLIEIVFRSIKIAIKSVCESLFVSIGAQLVLDQLKYFRPIESIFRSIENRVENFQKLIFTCSNSLFQKFFNFFSLYTTWSRLQSDFLSFSTILFARFLSPKAGKTFIPFLLHLFSLFMHQIMHYLGNFDEIFGVFLFMN